MRKPKVEGIPPKRPENEDQDVKAERERVTDVISGTGDEYLLVRDLVKKYLTADPNGPPQQDLNASMRSDRPVSVRSDEQENQVPDKGTMAVKGTSFGVGRGECFALLGVNGAGKSTTFNCITGYDVASGGEVLLDGVNVNTYYK